MMTLPDNTFFTPTAAFLDDFVKTDRWRYTHWQECGAGNGLFGAVLTSLGVEATCYDLHARESVVGTSHEVAHHPIRFADCTTLHWVLDDTVVVARPSHGPWSGEVMRRATQEAGAALYIGLERNVHDDLHGLVFEKVFDGAGEEGENVYQVYGHVADVTEWHLLKWGYWGEGHPGSWVMDGGDRWVHEGGSWMPKPKEDAEVVEVRLACQRDHLPSVWRPQKVDNSTRDGWVTPDGTWHPCGYWGHDTYVAGRFHITVGRAEDLRFARCQVVSHDTSRHFWTLARDEMRLTPKQKRTLLDLGFRVEEGETTGETAPVRKVVPPKRKGLSK